MATFTTPKLKAEFVEVIAAATGLPKEKLMEHSTERLKEAWVVMKPVKARVLPPNWRKFDLQALKELYVEVVVPYYRREEDNHWLRMKRNQLIMELELFLIDRSQDLKEQGEDRAVSGMPACPSCGVPMIVRNNRITKEPFLGCRLFPTCRSTLPMSALDPVAEHIPVPSTPKSKTKKRGGDPNSDGSWVRMDQEKLNDKTINANITEEELEIIRARRAQTE